MIKFCDVKKVVLHFVGNKFNGEGVRISNEYLDFSPVKKDLVALVSSAFDTKELYTFKQGEGKENKMYSYTQQVFDNPNDLLRQSVYMAKALYEQGNSGKVLPGELWVLYVENISFKGESVSGIILLKTEKKEKNVILKPTSDGFEVASVETFSLQKADKGCLILNTEVGSEYVVSCFNKNSKSGDIKYWVSDFLQLEPCQTAFHQTKTLLKVCGNFLKSQTADLSKKDKALLVSKIKNVMRSSDTISLEEFAQEAYGEVYGKKFIEYARSQEDAYQLPLKPLSLEPKMGQAKTAFPKTTIHLDSNFDITIFGGEGYVVKGKDEESGLNYYTLYFEKER